MSVTASTATPTSAATSASPGSPATTASPVTRPLATPGTRPPAGGGRSRDGDAPAGGLPVSAVSLLARARALESRSGHAHPTLAGAYRRRAAELRLEAWLRAVKSTPPPDIEQFTSLAA
jgi:hypothetical protein